MGRLAALGSILVPLALIVGCGRVAAAPTHDDSEEAGSTGLPDARPADEGGDNESGPVDAMNDESGDEAGDGGALVSGDASASIAARMNDVSILFPLPTSADGVGNLLSPSAIGLGGPLLPSGVYARMGFIEGSTPVGADAGVPLPPFVNPGVPPFEAPGGSYNIAAYGDLRVVAMRIDPCFGSLDPDPSGAGCRAQLRLVLQEVRWVPDAGAAVFDSAIHVFYDLSRSQFLALARALVDLRTANANGDDLGSLAPHPIMVRQGLAGPMSQGVQRLILAYAGEQNLVRSAEASDTSEAVNCGGGCPSFAGSWGLAAFDLTGAPLAATPRAIPTLATPDGGGVIAQGITFLGSFTVVQPTTTSSDDYSAIYNVGAVNVLPSPQIQAALDALVRVENPRNNSPDTIDCASCHLATQIEQSSGHGASFNDTTSPLSYSPDGIIVTRSDMQATLPPNNFFDIHAFSYLGPPNASLGPSISQRVVNETAAVVEYLNALPP